MAGARRIVVEFLGDGRNLTNTIGDIEGRTSRMGGVLGKVGKAAFLGLAAGATVAVTAGAKFAQMAADDEQAANLLAGALERNAGANKKQVAGVESWISAIGRAKGVTDDELRPALSRLVTATHDVQKAQVLAQVAMDVSAGSGKSLESVSTALMKAQNGQVSALSRLGINTKLTTAEQQAMARASVEASNGTITMEQALKTAASQTITMDQAVARMTDTFGGAASEKAQTLQGKMDRLKIILTETAESIGAKLLPVVAQMADWFLVKAMPAISQVGAYLQANLVPTLVQLGGFIQTNIIPALQGFASGMQNGTGAGGAFVAALSKTRDAIATVSNFLASHKEAVVVLSAAYVAYRGTMLAVSAVQAAQLIILKAHTVGTVQHTAVSLAANAASKTWAATQWLLNAALTANPIGIVVVAIAALAAGVIVAYNKSETFREGVQLLGKAFGGAVSAVGEFGSMVLEKIGNIVGYVKAIPGKITGAFGNAGSILSGIGAAIMDGLISGITSKVSSLVSKLQEITSLIPKVKGPESKDAILLKPAGVKIMQGLIDGIDSGKVKLRTVLEKLTNFIAKKGDQLQALLDKRRAILDSFAGMTSSIFSMSMDPTANEDGSSTPKSVTDLLAFQSDQRARAERLRSNVSSLTSKGLSADLLRQLMAAGQAGQEQINLLATATEDQIAQANADNLATQQALQAAGMEASRALGIEADIRATERDIKQAEIIKQGLKELLDQENKNTVVELHLDGHRILWSLKKIKRQNGGHLGLGDADKD